ncbi:MAG: hypothetical protein HFE77_02355 [Clostridiales bacterium]|nr:hypothetical protein [Clostridiales bacterium]
MENKTLLMIGLAAKAGQITAGTELVCEQIRKGRACLVLVSKKASANTQKKVVNCCTYYHSEYRIIDVDQENLGRFIGKQGSISCAAVKDENLAKAIKDSINRCN